MKARDGERRKAPWRRTLFYWLVALAVLGAVILVLDPLHFLREALAG